MIILKNSNFMEKKIVNVAIIAHVDHGKTTLVDAILKQSNVFRDNEKEMDVEQILDSGDLEREKGITIQAKNIAINYGDTKINIIDTPGHADFGGEVERTLNMANGCILVVDAQEGPMIQTRIVLRKAMEIGLKPIVVINKIDKKLANIGQTVSRIQDLFLELATEESQLEYPTFYAIARDGKVFSELPQDLSPENLTSLTGSVKPLLDCISTQIPTTEGNPNEAFQMQICSLEFDSFNGRYLIGKISRGTAKNGLSVQVVDSDNEVHAKGNIKKVLVREGLKFVEATSPSVGEIVAITGIDSTAIGSTICDSCKLDPLPSLKISPPSIEVKIEPNTSPLVGQDGKLLTARLLQKRLDKEKEQNISLKIITSDGGSNSVFVRGELQLSILIETLRREGFEFQIRKPKIVTKEENGITMEPLEELSIEVPEEFSSVVVQELSLRNAELIDMQNESDKVTFEYKILTRKLLGLRNYLNTQTKGQLLFSNAFIGYEPFKELKEPPKRGMLVSMESGETREYSLNTIQERGDLFVGGSELVYEGMIIGLNKFEEEMEVNPVKERKKSGVRVHHAMITLTDLKTPMRLTIESALEIMTDEELLEVTPNHIRLRKVYLTKTERDWSKRKNLTDYAKKQLGIK